MSTKLELLQRYCDVQGRDELIWTAPETPAINYLQRKLRELVWLIEDAGRDEILDCIATYKAQLDDK